MYCILKNSTPLCVNIPQNKNKTKLGIGPGNNYPYRGMKATPWEGGTRVMGFITGGFLPSNLRGGNFHRVIGVQDWYPTICALAGVDSTDNAAIGGVVYPIDGVNVWPAILASANATTADTDDTAASPSPPPTFLHEWLPTTQSSVIYQERWKLITGADSTQWYTPNNTKVPDHWPCRGKPPPSPSPSPSPPSPSPPPPSGPCTAVAGYTCHTLTFCGPPQTFYTEGAAATAEECAAKCTANSTGCGCFDFWSSGAQKKQCRLHGNHGNHLQKSGMYTAYVKSSTGAGSSSSSSSSSSGAAAEWMAWDARVARDVLHEEELARKVTKDYHHANGGAADVGVGGCSVCTNTEPCLFDVIADPSETQDVSKANPDVVKTIQAKIATGVFKAYIGYSMNASQLANYDCPSDIRPWWGNFSGPCCKPKQA